MVIVQWVQFLVTTAFFFVILCFVSLYTAGETLDLGLQEWCYNVVGRNQCLLLDIWWQTGKKIIQLTQ